MSQFFFKQLYPLPLTAPIDDDAYQTSYLLIIGCVVLEVLLVGEVKEEEEEEESLKTVHTFAI